MEKVLSVIIPTYNMERYLEKCLSSLVVDDIHMSMLDVIVVNDGSKDGSLQIAQTFASRFPDSVQVIDKENGNYGSCINRGLQSVRGKYVKVLDADDSFDNDNLAVYLDYLNASQADCVISDYMQCTFDESRTRTWSFDLPKTSLFTLNGLGHYQWTVQMHAVCYRTQLLKTIEYRQTEGISYTDQEWVFLPMSYSQSLVYFHKVIYRYMIGRDGQTVNPTTWDKNFWQEIKGLKVMMEERQEHLSASSEAGKAYQDVRIKTRMQAIYKAYFLKFRTCRNNDMMIQFDRLVKSYDKDLYDSFGEYYISRIFPYRYIKAWRGNGHRQTVIHRMNKLVYRVLNRIKRSSL